MESNAAVTLHFEDLVGEKSQIVYKGTFDKCEVLLLFFSSYILKTKCNSVRERAFFTLSCTLLYVVFKIFKKKNFTLIKSAFLNDLQGP